METLPSVMSLSELASEKSAARSSEPEDVQLIARILAGDERACETLVRRNAGRMLAVARRFLRLEEDRADAVQDAFISAFRSLKSFEGHSSLVTWLHRIVVNACLMKLRSESRRRAVPMDDLLPTFGEKGNFGRPIQARTGQPEELLVRDETRSQVRDCIDRLPDTHRTILLLRDIEERSTGETAVVLGIAPGAVKTRLHRAREALRVLLEQHVCSASCV
jgi:RNA polymerase sigma-70 factor (ECF subfamily)